MVFFLGLHMNLGKAKRTHISEETFVTCLILYSAKGAASQSAWGKTLTRRTARIALSALAMFVREFLGRCPRLHMKAAPLALPSAILTDWYEERAVKARLNGAFRWGKLRRSIERMFAPFTNSVPCR
jgi:hypothetical protein